ncbi:hypothetical protein [Nostoc edaphicum]|nr:hypothetical protein [Nostoc edaphicum]
MTETAYWELGMGHWALGINYSPLLPSAQSPLGTQVTLTKQI